MKAPDAQTFLIRAPVTIAAMVLGFLFCEAPPVQGQSFKEKFNNEAGVIHLSFSQTLQLARKRHVNMILADERIVQALAVLGENRSALFPQVRATAQQARQTRDLSSAGISLPGQRTLVGPFNSFDARLKITQTLFDASLCQRLKTAQENAQLSTTQYQKTEQDVLALIANFFVQARRAEQTFQLSQTFLERDQKHLKLAYSRFESGTGSFLETKQANAQCAQSLYRQELAKTQALQKRLDLASALGMALDQPIVFEPLNDSELNFLKTFEDSPGEMLDFPDVEVAEKELQKKKSERSLERAEYFPKISALADYGPSGIDPNNFSETYTLGVQASFPIFEGGLRKARLKEADSQVKAGQANLADVKIHAQAKILDDLQTILQVKRLLEEKDAQKAVTDHQLQLAQERLVAGTGSDLEVTDSLAQVVLSDDEKDESLSAYVMAQIQLAHDLGKMDRLFLEKN